MRHHTTTAGLVTGTLLAAGLTAGLAPGLTATATAASGAGAFHLYVPEEWDGTSHWAADDNPCGAWATTFHEVRHGGYRLLGAPGGQVEGEVHINGSVDGWVELTPDDPSLPSYSGGYREKVDGVLTNPTTTSSASSSSGCATGSPARTAARSPSSSPVGRR